MHQLFFRKLFHMMNDRKLILILPEKIGEIIIKAKRAAQYT